jgi:hypothetical protein
MKLQHRPQAAHKEIRCAHLSEFAGAISFSQLQIGGDDPVPDTNHQGHVLLYEKEHIPMGRGLGHISSTGCNPYRYLVAVSDLRNRTRTASSTSTASTAAARSQ